MLNQCLLNNEEIDDIFNIYEKNSNNKLATFHSISEDYSHYNFQPFKIVRRLTLKEADFECMPMWKIEFNDGKQIDTFVEEIFKPVNV